MRALVGTFQQRQRPRLLGGLFLRPGAARRLPLMASLHNPLGAVSSAAGAALRPTPVRLGVLGVLFGGAFVALHELTTFTPQVAPLTGEPTTDAWVATVIALELLRLAACGAVFWTASR